MDVLLKEAGYCSTTTTGKAGTGNGRVACLDYTQLSEHAASAAREEVRKRSSVPHAELHLQPCRRVATLTNEDGLREENAVRRLAVEG
ncbi:MAG: hypothetical protein ACLPHP_14695 [Candidatus Sulfotelmatobacter sp.]